MPKRARFNCLPAVGSVLLERRIVPGIRNEYEWIDFGHRSTYGLRWPLVNIVSFLGLWLLALVFSAGAWYKHLIIDDRRLIKR
ncbi:MAG: hypothetical protein NTZ04_07130 [Chloroflexi bacterium]|nr:hypothetical protein [Chloroflexota bacterium]